MGKEIDEILKKYSKENDQIRKLVEERERLLNTPFPETSKEQLDKLSEKVDERNQKLKDIINAINKDLGTKINISDMDGGFKQLENRLESLKKKLKNTSNVIEELNDTIISCQEENLTLKEIIADSTKSEEEKKEAKELLNKNKETIAKTNIELRKQNNLYNKQKKEIDDLNASTSALRDAHIEYLTDANKEQEELNKRIVEGTTFMDDFGEKMAQRTKALRRGFSEIQKGTKQIVDSAKKIFDPWAKANHEAMAYAKTMGMSQKTADGLLKNTVEWTSKNNIGLLFNKTTDELIKMQNKYSEVLGRNVQLTDEQKKDMLAMEAIIGEDSMMDIANNLENFGMGLSDSAAFVKKTFDTATKSGIAASKLTKTIRENIKMAQDYTFKNGLDGLASMAKKAVELKTDMSLVNGFIEKTSTVEGAISTGAQLQVLGGSYAMGSDPLSMLHDSLINVEGMFDRAVGMAQGKVFYNNETGNFEMSGFDRYMMKQAAQSMGVDPSKMIDVAFRKASLDRIEGQIKANSRISGDQEMVDMVKNLATWNNGEAVVNIGGKDTKVKDLDEKDKEKLEAMQRTDSQNLQDMAISLRSMNDIMSGVQKEKQNEQADIMKGIGEKLTNHLKNSTGLLNAISKIGAWSETIFGLGGILTGIWGTVGGILMSMNGVGNLFGRRGFGRGRGVGRGRGPRMGGPSTAGNAPLPKGKGTFTQTVVTAKNGKQYVDMGKGMYKPVDGGRMVRAGTKPGNISIQSTTKSLTKLGKGAAAGASAGVLSAGVSLVGDAISGDLKKDTGASIGRAVGSGAGAAIGAAIGSAICPGVGTLIGGFIGDWVGSEVTGGIQKAQKKARGTIRDEIANRLTMTIPNAADLFTGEGALEGNYNKRQLNKLEKALEDGVINETELSGAILRKLRANDDLTKIRDAGIRVNVKYADGGIFTAHGRKGVDNKGLLVGKSHAEGGMRVEGTDKEVEDGEFIVNEKATKRNRMVLEMMNLGEKFKISAKEPLGKIMKVSNHNGGNISNSNRNSNLTVNPISVSLSGTIKLDSGNRQVDITNELLNNPQFISKFTDMISKQINILEYGSYNKNLFKQKFI